MPNQNDDFNFESFSVNAIWYIDSIRAYAKYAGRPTESRINAFYRALGLPAVIPDSEQGFIYGSTDPVNNGNTHSLSFETYSADLDERIALFDTKPTDSEIENFLDFNQQDIKAGLSKSETNRRKRGVLFPMVVDGRINVFPQNRRVAGAFMTEKELKQEQTKYKRPLIESILYIKLKGDNTVDSVKQSGTSAAFQNVELGKLDKNISIRLSKTLQSVVLILEHTVNKIGRLRTITGKNVIPTISNIVQQNHSIQVSDNKTGALDSVATNQNNNENTQNSILALFEFDDNSGNATRNLVEVGLTDLFLEMLVPQDRIKKQRRLIDARVTKSKQDLKSVFRTMDLFLGTFSGISGIDIMIIIMALFSLEPEYLVGLLNKESQDRLKKIKGTTLPAITGAKSASESISKLESEVRVIFDELTEYIKVTKHEEKIRNIKEEEEN